MDEWKEVSRSVLSKIIELFEPISCVKGKIIVKEGEKFDYIYFIREGEFEMSKIIKMSVT